MTTNLFPPPEAIPRGPDRIRFLMAALAAPVILVALLFWLGAQFRHVDAMRNMIRESYERRIGATQLLMSLAQAESAQRGYVLSADRAVLVPYLCARGEVAVELRRLDTLYAGDSAQAARLARLHKLIDAKFVEMQAVIDARARRGSREQDVRALAADGQPVMDSARAITTALLDAEEASLGARMQFVRERDFQTERLFRILAVLVVILIEIGLWVVWRAQAQRYRGELEAHATSGRLLAIFASTTDSVLIIDAAGLIQTVNVAATQLFGREASELIGSEASALLDFARGHGDFAERVGLGGDRLIGHNLLDRTVQHQDGREIPVDIGVAVLPLPGERQIIASIRDISDRKAVERLKDEFLGTVSHELRTPLTSVIGALGLLRNGSATALPDSAQRLVEIAENNSRRLIRLVNDLLDIDRIGSGRMRFERTSFDLVGTTRAAIEGARGLADERSVRIELVAGQLPLVVDGDHDRLLQVLANLLSNAIRVSPDDGLVLVSLAQQAGQVVVTVDDEGPGVSPDFANRIFERFAQAFDATPGGSGLGLAISREIIAAHHGRIWFGDAPGGGARFCFSLPLVREPQPLRGSRPCILIGVADPEAERMLREALEAEDCGVESVATDREVQEAARTGRYDALVLDAALPEAGGLETARALRRRSDTRKLPAIIVSADAADERRETSDTAPELIDWIEKPIDPAQLVAAVRRAMERSAAIRPTLLHIDGDPDMLEVAAAVLAAHGRIVHATSVASARAVLATQSPDVVILDLSLADGSGSELLPELLRADGSAIPTVIYSANDIPPELEEQVDAVLIKSRRSLGSLARAIHRILATVEDDTTAA